MMTKTFVADARRAAILGFLGWVLALTVAAAVALFSEGYAWLSAGGFTAALILFAGGIAAAWTAGGSYYPSEAAFRIMTGELAFLGIAAAVAGGYGALRALLWATGDPVAAGGAILVVIVAIGVVAVVLAKIVALVRD